jgi:hypothetical protein
MHIIVSPPSLANKQTPRESLFHGKKAHTPRQEPPKTKKETVPGIFNPFSLFSFFFSYFCYGAVSQNLSFFLQKTRIA